ncbi:KEOPS complex subunit Pcc1 [Candidatus Altiarchaeota archaeon]
MNRLELGVALPSDKAQVLVGSLHPETTQKQARSEVTVKQGGDGLVIEVEAQDLHAMRAAVNTYLRYMIMNLKLLEE